MKKILKTKCHICKKTKECHLMLIYENKEYQNVYVCLKCYKKGTK